MKKEVILELLSKFEQACYVISGVECWSARELQSILGYARWENFVNAINKAKKAAENASADIEDHFRDVTKMIDLTIPSFRALGSLSERAGWVYGGNVGLAFELRACAEKALRTGRERGKHSL